MPNSMSPDSRRVNFIWDKDAYDALVEKAAAKRCSVGELIRQAIEEKYADIPVENPVINIRVAKAPVSKKSPNVAPSPKTNRKEKAKR